MSERAVAAGTTYELPSVGQAGSARVVITPSSEAPLHSTGADMSLGRIETAILGNRDGGALRINTPRGGIGSLAYEQTGDVLKLSGQEGAIGWNQDMVQVAARAGLGSPDQAASLAHTEAFLPTRAAFVVETPKGPQVLAFGGGGGKKPPRNLVAAGFPEEPDGPNWAIGLLNDGDGFNRRPTQSIRAAVADESLALGNDAKIQFAEANPLANGEAERVLNEARWQRIRPLDQQGPLTDALPAHVERVFTGEGPKGTRFVVDWKLPDGKSLKVHVTGDAIYLERPTVAADHEWFNLLVNEQGVTSQRARSLISRRGPRPNRSRWGLRAAIPSPPRGHSLGTRRRPRKYSPGKSTIAASMRR